jgi:hypothetical protein
MSKRYLKLWKDAKEKKMEARILNDEFDSKLKTELELFQTWFIVHGLWSIVHSSWFIVRRS